MAFGFFQYLCKCTKCQEIFTLKSCNDRLTEAAYKLARDVEHQMISVMKGKSKYLILIHHLNYPKDISQIILSMTTYRKCIIAMFNALTPLDMKIRTEDGER